MAVSPVRSEPEQYRRRGIFGACAELRRLPDAADHAAQEPGPAFAARIDRVRDAARPVLQRRAGDPPAPEPREPRQPAARLAGDERGRVYRQDHRCQRREHLPQGRRRRDQVLARRRRRQGDHHDQGRHRQGRSRNGADKTKGPHVATWDGKNNDGVAQPDGQYSISVAATKGQDIAVKATTTFRASSRRSTAPAVRFFCASATPASRSATSRRSARRRRRRRPARCPYALGIRRSAHLMAAPCETGPDTTICSARRGSPRRPR